MKDRKQKEMKGEAADKPPETEAAETPQAPPPHTTLFSIRSAAASMQLAPPFSAVT